MSLLIIDNSGNLWQLLASLLTDIISAVWASLITNIEGAFLFYSGCLINSLVIRDVITPDTRQFFLRRVEISQHADIHIITGGSQCIPL